MLALLQSRSRLPRPHLDQEGILLILSYKMHLRKSKRVKLISEPLFIGCTTQSSGDPQPNECNVCRVAKDAASGNCLPECKEPNYLTPDNFCVDKSGECLSTDFYLLPFLTLSKAKAGLKGNRKLICVKYHFLS